MAEESPLISDLSDTARWVAMYRAMESERPDALFRDPYARRLAGERGPEILERLPGGRSMGWAMVVRTAVFDEILLRQIRNPGAHTVLDLAAGLDARPWRMRLPADLRWIDVDVPGILEAKRDAMAGETPKCRYEVRPLDLKDREGRRRAFREWDLASRPTIALTEGLVIYLDPDDVALLAHDLHEAGVRWWLLDLASPRLLQVLERRMGNRLSLGGPTFRFGPADGSRFFAAFGWKEIEFRSTWEESRRLKREMQPAWLFHLLSRFASAGQREEWRRFAGIVLLQRM